LNRFLLIFIEAVLLAISGLVIVGIFVLGEKMTPGLNVMQGDIIYSINKATSTTIVTGYKVPVGQFLQLPPQSYTVASVYSSLTTQERVLKSQLPRRTPERPSTDSRTTVERSTVAKHPSPSLAYKKEELLNPYVIESIIKQSDRTYYFSEKSLTRGDVTVEILSLTPRQGDYFLKYRITNASKEYFIPQTVAVKHGNDWVDVEKFFPKYLVEGGQSCVGYLRVKVPYSTSSVQERVFQLNESGGAFRKYSIFY